MARRGAGAELEEVEDAGGHGRRAPNIFSILAGFVVLLMLGTCVWAVAVYANPRAPYNPFPPPTASLTPSVTPPPSATPLPPTPAPSSTPTPGPSPTPTPVPRWVTEIGSRPQSLPGRACVDHSFAGVVQDRDGNALGGYTVRLTGNDGFARSAAAGSAEAYGPGGWEILLVNDEGRPQPLQVGYVAHLLDAGQVEVISTEPYDIVLSDRCDEGLIFIVFRQE
jgi:hypothetical protein